MQRESVQCRCSERLRADGSKGTQASSEEESEAEVQEVEEESGDEFCDRTTAPVPKWEVPTGNKAVWVQLTCGRVTSWAAAERGQPVHA
jgi:hypothetical protein